MPQLHSNASSNLKDYFSLSSWAMPIFLSAFLILMSTINFLLFHTLAEFFAITIAILASVVAWNMYPFTRNNYLMYLGVGYFWIGLLDLMHALSYKGMVVIPEASSNVAVQIWVGTRYLEALLLLSAPWFLTHNLRRNGSFLLFGLIASVILYLIFSNNFPLGFVEGKGLTAFKIYSEYVIIFILIISIFYLYFQRRFLEHQIIYPLVASIIFTMCAELAFTFYISLYGISNIAGHIFKIFSFWLIFKAIIRTTLKEPFLVMSRTATTYDAIPDATIVIDDNGLIREVNKAACELSKLSEDELIGSHNHEIFHPSEKSSEQCLVCKAIAHNAELRGLEIEIDEVGTWYDFTLSTIKGVSNLKGTVEVIRDISSKKESEFKVNQITNLTNSIVENLPSMVIVKDAATHEIIEWNKASEEITGVSKAEALGKTDFDFWPKAQAQLFIDKDDDVVRQQRIADISQESLTTEANGTRILHTKKIPIFDQKGKVQYLLGISDDITERLKTEKMLNHSQKMDAIGQMSGGIAHDFNNQLGVILGYIELLSEQSLAEQQLKWIRAIKGAGERCADLTRQLLSFSRNDEDDRKIVNINKLIADMELIIKRSLTPSINMSYAKDENIWLLDINPGAFKDMLLNLLLNARDAMPLGGDLIIETSNFVLDKDSDDNLKSMDEGDYVQIIVKDSGTGMTKDVEEHLFEPFFTTKEIGKGTGLGMPMVYSFVHRHQGEILLDTVLGEGTTFKVCLPRCSKEEQKIHSNELDKPSRLGCESILIVDDEEDLLLFAKEILSGWGYKIYTASNAMEALTLIENTNLDVLFSDVVMPGQMNGFELAVKSLDINPSLKVLITSGFADKFEDSGKYLDYNFKQIAKPYTSSDLATSLKELLD